VVLVAPPVAQARLLAGRRDQLVVPVGLLVGRENQPVDLVDPQDLVDS
jgi:hypothetical protein